VAGLCAGHCKKLVMEDNGLVKALREKFPDAILEVTALRDLKSELTIRVKKDRILDICTCLKKEFKFNFLSDLCGVHYPDRDEKFEVVYHLFSIETKERVRLKAGLREGEKVKSVTSVWGTADWHEREAFDLLGIGFEGHPNLKRILLPDDWEGHPLRKDYPYMSKDLEPEKTS